MKKRKAICLISDGLDSPIAAFLLERKGIEVIGLNFNNSPLVIPAKKWQDEKKRVLAPPGTQIKDIAQKLVNAFTHQKTFDLYIVPNGEDLQKIVKHSGDAKVNCILCKRLMLKKAEQLASHLEVDFITTGEILGEQASQTIDNLKNIESSLKTHTLIRPLIGLNKEEVISFARKVGTYESSEISAKYTCGAVPNKPATHADLTRVLTAEKKVNLEDSIKVTVERAQKHTYKKNT